jgi:hypothetical protein
VICCGESGDAVDAGQKAGQDGDVRGIRDRTVSEGLGEADAVGGERIQSRGFDLFVSVAADVIGAQGIDCDQENVWFRGGE